MMGKIMAVSFIIPLVGVVMAIGFCSASNEGGQMAQEGEPGIDEETFAKILNTQKEAAQYFEELCQTYDDDQAREMTVDWLLQQDNVQDAGISIDETTIWIRYEIGISGIILTYSLISSDKN
jgi:hypothetical protein